MAEMDISNVAQNFTIDGSNVQAGDNVAVPKDVLDQILQCQKDLKEQVSNLSNEHYEPGEEFDYYDPNDEVFYNDGNENRPPQDEISTRSTVLGSLLSQLSHLIPVVNLEPILKN